MKGVEMREKRIAVIFIVEYDECVIDTLEVR